MLIFVRMLYWHQWFICNFTRYYWVSCRDSGKEGVMAGRSEDFLQRWELSGIWRMKRTQRRLGTLGGWFVVALKLFFHRLVLLKSRDCVPLFPECLSHYLVVNVYQSLLQTSENCVSLTLVKEKEMVEAAEVFLVARQQEARKECPCSWGSLRPLSFGLRSKLMTTLRKVID